MTDTRLAQILRYLADNDGASLPRVAKQLALSQSELMRLLAALSDDPSMGGLGLVESKMIDTRRLLFLSDRGRAWLSNHA
jgi:DNA-binding MarR family transcriptional regulator